MHEPKQTENEGEAQGHKDIRAAKHYTVQKLLNKDHDTPV
jgi:hypothetical protein